MQYLHAWTIFIISFQTSIAVSICWLTLDCQLSPRHREYPELTLIKMLYFYDPEACQRVIFYNVSCTDGKRVKNTIIWPKKNAVAANYRRLVRYSGSFHVIWLLLSIFNVAQMQKSYGFYAACLPATCAGACLLVTDLVYTGLFLADLKHTNTETAILSYIGAIDNVSEFYQHQSLPVLLHPRPAPDQLNGISWVSGVSDTSWVSLVMAYCCCRGVALWIVNFWLVKDNYFYALACHRQIHAQKVIMRRNAIEL